MFVRLPGGDWAVSQLREQHRCASCKGQKFSNVISCSLSDQLQRETSYGGWAVITSQDSCEVTRMDRQSRKLLLEGAASPFVAMDLCMLSNWPHTSLSTTYLYSTNTGIDCLFPSISSNCSIFRTVI